MLRNYLGIAVRNVTRHKGHSLISVGSLAVGMACCLMIALWMAHELSFDRFHANADDLYQVLTQGETIKDNPGTPAPLATVLAVDFPEVLHVSRYDGGLGEVLVSNGDRRFYEGGVRAVDPPFFRMFDFTFLHGDPSTALNEMYSMVISQEIAGKYFGSDNPVGQILTVNGSQGFTITGVMEPIPSNSSLRFGIAVRHEIRQQRAREETGNDMGWGWFAPQTFVQLREGTSIEDFEPKAAGVISRHTDQEDAEISFLPYVERYDQFWQASDRVYLFGFIAVLVLIVASLNYVNLTTARSAGRAREIGMRKVIGASRTDIIVQLLGETLLMTLLTALLAVFLTINLAPVVSSLTGLPFSWENLPLASTAGILVGLVVVVSIMAGGYPASVISSVQPVAAVSGSIIVGPKGKGLRRVLVVAQFTVSVLLIVAAATVSKQSEYLLGHDVGYNKDNIISIRLNGSSKASYQVLKTRLSSDHRILNVSGCTAAFPYFNWNTTTSEADWGGKNPEDEPREICINYVDYGFVEALGMGLVAGRSFSSDFPSDVSGYMINEEMAELMGGQTVAGSDLTLWSESGPVIGIMRNFHFQSLEQPIKSLVFLLKPDRVQSVVVRLQPEEIMGTVGFVEEVWNELVPDYPFEYQFLDQEFGAVYSHIERTADLVAGLSWLAVLVACMGLFGLASFAAQARSQEIAVRKILGARASQIVVTLSKELFGCITAANLIGWLVAYLALNEWLANYAYRTDFGLASCLQAFALTLAAAAITVGYQTMKAARANPAERLRHE
jgi:ABC-type antimicrobial peptide transport system permease subunit